jgi:DNA invertase Pin-like site-specific DNA recombinase
MTTRAAIYCRISKDAEDRGLGVARQQDDCERLAAAEGWTVAATFVDNDLSAARKNGDLPGRPDFDRLVAAVKAKTVDVVIAYEIDRLFRDPLEAENFYLLAERAGLRRLRTVSDDVDLARGDLLVARVKAAVAAEEVRKLRQRVERKHIELAAAGRPKGGPRGFGYEADAVTVRDTEAALIREAADRVLSGDACHAIATSWNARRIVTATGGAWRGKKIADLLRQPRIAGLRVHHGEVVGEAVWPAIIDRATWERVVLVLASRARTPQAPPRRYLLGSDILRCGRCGARMHSQPCRGVPGYFCKKDSGGCNGLRVNAEPLEDVIEAAVLAVFEGPALAAAADARRRSTPPSRRADLVAEIEAAEEKVRQFAEDFAADRIKRPAYLAGVAAAERRAEDARDELAQLDDVHVAGEYVGRPDLLRARWPDLPLATKRRIVGEVIETVTIKPTGKRGNRFDPARVDVEWKV